MIYYSEDFETGILSGWTDGDSVPTISSTVARGVYSLKFSTNNTKFRHNFPSPILVYPSGTTTASLWFNMAQRDTDDCELGFYGVSEGVSKFYGFNLSRETTGSKVYIYTPEGGDTIGGPGATDYVVVLSKWYKVELKFDMDLNIGSLTLYDSDGISVIIFKSWSVAIHPIESITAVYFSDHQNSIGFVLYIDDIIIEGAYRNEIISGTITGPDGSLVSRVVRIYDRSSGALLASTISDPVTGVYAVTTAIPDLPGAEVQRVVLDSATEGVIYNDIIDRILPQ